MNITDIKPDPNSCPLCGMPNNCMSLSAKESSKACWCSAPSIKFPKELLSTVPDNMKGKACICKRCVLNFQADNDQHHQPKK